MEKAVRDNLKEVLTIINRERDEAERLLREKTELTGKDRIRLHAKIAAWDKTLEILNDSGFKPSDVNEHPQDILSALRRIQRMRDSTIKLSIVRPNTEQELDELNTKSNVYDMALSFLADKGFRFQG